MEYFKEERIYTAKDFGKDISLSELDFESNKYAQQIATFKKNLENNNLGLKVAYESNVLTPAEFQQEVGDIDKFNEILTDSYEKTLDLLEHKLIIKTELEGYEDLSPDEQIEQRIKTIEKINKALFERLDKIPNVKYYVKGFERSLESIIKNERWALPKLGVNEQSESLAKKIGYIKDKNFEAAYDEAVKLNQEPTRENLPLNFMKDVIKEHGTETSAISQAVSAVTFAEGETAEFMANLMQDTLKTDEYKKAFEAGQGKTQENTR